MNHQTYFQSWKPFILTLALILADQISKLLVIALIPLRTVGFSMGNDFFRLIHVRNTGVAFSMGDSLPLELRKALFILMPLAVLVFLAVHIVRTREETVFQRFCLAGILGGGFGNLIDRIFRPEGVVDFLDVRFYGLFGLERWPTFNIADSSVVVCGILLFVSFWGKEKKLMNKKLNTVLFMLGGTVVNIVLMLGLFLLFLYMGNLILTPETDSNLKMLVFLLIIGLSVVGSFFLYSRIVKIINKKWNLEEYMHPLFSRKR